MPTRPPKKVINGCGSLVALGLILSTDSGNPFADELVTKTSLDFRRDVFPILSRCCWECHLGGDASSGIRLDVREDWLGETTGRPLVVIGKSEKSRVIEVLEARDPKIVMPAGVGLPWSSRSHDLFSGGWEHRFESFEAVKAWVEIALTTVRFLEHERVRHLADRRLIAESRRWWQAQRLHGLCCAYRQESAGRKLKYLADRLKTSGCIEKLKRLLNAALPKEFRIAT